MLDPNLETFLKGPVVKNDPILNLLFAQINSRNDVIFYVPNVYERRLEYINSTCYSKLGYSTNEFLEGGPDFIFSITDPRLIPQILERQVNYTRTSRCPGFDPRSIFIQEFSTAMFSKGGELVSFHCICTPLTYTLNADFGVVTAILVDPHNNSIQEGRETLQQIKARHNEIYSHPPFELVENTLDPVYTTRDRVDQLITRREKDVLSLLSKGFSTKEIGSKLSISSHTAESHRKSLLEKFEAKNAAELVKKASKVFWL